VKNPSSKFLELLKSGTLIVGVGNPLRGDDGAGIVLMQRLKGIVTAEFLDCGVAPENYLEKIAGIAPRTVVILDAVDLKQPPGTIRLINAEAIARGGISTHSISLRMFTDYLNQRLEEVAIFVLGIQPLSVTLGEGLSDEVERSIDLFVKQMHHHKNRPEASNA